MFKIMKHGPNQHGWGLSLIKYENNELYVEGFVLNTFRTEYERDRYCAEFVQIMGFEKGEDL